MELSALPAYKYVHQTPIEAAEMKVLKPQETRKF